MSSTDSDIRAAQTRVGTTWREDSQKDPEELEREIDATRADVQATLGALEQRLSAEHLLDLTIGRVREHGGAFAGNLGSAARDNPVPLVLTSIGIAWLMMSGRNGNGARTRCDRVSASVRVTRGSVRARRAMKRATSGRERVTRRRKVGRRRVSGWTPRATPQRMRQSLCARARAGRRPPRATSSRARAPASTTSCMSSRSCSARSVLPPVL